MSELTGLSVSTIDRLRTAEKDNYSLDQVMVICIALHLPPWLSSQMIKRAGLLLKDTELHNVYRAILDCMFMDSLEMVQAFLVESGYKPLKLKA